MVDQKNLVASIRKTFDLGLETLHSRIAFQKTVYLLQEIGSKNDFSFRWHNFGPYSSELSQRGFSLTEEEISNATLLTGESTDKFKELIKGNEKNSRFFEMLADIIYINKNMGIKNEKEIFLKMVEHREYLNDESLFKLAIRRLSILNLI